MTGQDMQVLAQGVLEAGRRMKIAGLDSLLAVNTLENLFIRMYKLYAPHRDKITLRLSLVEVIVLSKFVLPGMMAETGTLTFFVASGISETIEHWGEREVNLYNSMKPQNYAQNDQQ